LRLVLVLTRNESMNVAAFLIFSLSFMIFYCTVAFSS
jgi:hypothetical protein